MKEEGTVANRRAIEALRAGVPNGDAVRKLGSGQKEIIDEFDRKLAGAAALEAPEPTGFVISGGFGSGKSHVLEELHQRALASNYVSSKVTISKETPLHMPAKVLQSAVQAMQARSLPDDLLLELALRLRTDRPGYENFVDWCGTRISGISITFRSLLELLGQAGGSLDVLDVVVRYWAGEVTPISDLRWTFRGAGIGGAPLEAVRAAERPWQTVRFLARLCHAYGFRGWVILLDEVELVSNYGFASRARAYSQLGRWLGLHRNHRVPGTAAVATIINDFVPQVLDLRGDRWNVEPFLDQGRTPADPEGIPFAKSAIDALDDALVLKDIDRSHLQTAQRVLREAHSDAYHWQAPVLPVKFRAHQAMRLYVRRWINEWDLRRLYPGEHLDFQGEDITINYSDDPDMEAAAEG